jgi:hypothetical protein
MGFALAITEQVHRHLARQAPLLSLRQTFGCTGMKIRRLSGRRENSTHHLRRTEWTTLLPIDRVLSMLKLVCAVCNSSQTTPQYLNAPQLLLQYYVSWIYFGRHIEHALLSIHFGLSSAFIRCPMISLCSQKDTTVTFLTWHAHKLPRIRMQCYVYIKWTMN